MSKERAIPLEFEGEKLESVLVSRRDGKTRPAVILFPTMMGVSDLELGYARQLVELGYTAFVADLFGRRFRPGVDRDAAIAAIGQLKSDRAALRRRLLAVLDQVRGLDETETDQIVAAGFCFGGMCALDLARSGADLKGAAAFHGLFDPCGLEPVPISARVIAFHGWEDPMVPPDAVEALARELTLAGADWQIHAYGHVAHGFTNPNADKVGVEGVRYNEAAAERSWTAFVNFLEEVVG